MWHTQGLQSLRSRLNLRNFLFCSFQGLSIFANHKVKKSLNNKLLPLGYIFQQQKSFMFWGGRINSNNSQWWLPAPINLVYTKHIWGHTSYHNNLLRMLNRLVGMLLDFKEVLSCHVRGRGVNRYQAAIHARFLGRSGAKIVAKLYHAVAKGNIILSSVNIQGLLAFSPTLE